MLAVRAALRYTLVAFVIAAVPALAAWGTMAFAQDAYAAFYRSFAETSCCWTNKCCYEISENDVEDLGEPITVTNTWGRSVTGHGYRIKASGQVVVRTAFSPDGKYHRCSCDPSGTGWKVWPGANTRCLFTPFYAT
jgi:hypothetical protein